MTPISPAIPAPSAFRSLLRASNLSGVVAALLACAISLFASISRAEPSRSSAGAPFGPTHTRPTLPLRSCDPRAPLCVHMSPGVAPETIIATRAAFADAWDALIHVLRVPAPLLDGPLGGDPRLDVYLVPPSTEGLVDGLAIGRDPIDRLLDRDAASAFLLIADDVPRGCVLRATAARAIVRASSHGLDVSETPVIVDGFARRMAEVIAPCRAIEEPALIELQEKPWRALTDAPGRTAHLLRVLDRTRGQGFGAIVPALLSMSTNHRGIIVPPLGELDEDIGPVHFRNDPSVFDVLGITASDAGTSLEGLFLDWASARVLETPKPAWEWSVTTSSLPRKLAVRRGIETTGATFVRIDIDSPPKNDTLEIDLAWEQGSRFVWRLVQLDAAGNRLADVPVPVLETARSLTVEARHLAKVRTLVVVGVNIGDPVRPWNSAEPKRMPRGYEIGIYAGT